MKTFLKFRTLILLSIVVVALNSCKKDDDATIFPLEVYNSKLEVSSATRLYTKNGEIKDAQKVAKFVEKLDVFHAENDKSGIGTLAMTFLSADSVFFGSDKNRFGVSKNSDQFIFTSAQTVLTTNVNILLEHILLNLFKHQNIVGSYPIPSSNGYYNVKAIKEVRVAYGNYRELKFPMMAYSVKSTSGSGDAYTAAYSNGVINNEFEANATSYLKGNDTLAVKMYTVTCQRK